MLRDDASCLEAYPVDGCACNEDCEASGTGAHTVLSQSPFLPWMLLAKAVATSSAVVEDEKVGKDMMGTIAMI